MCKYFSKATLVFFCFFILYNSLQAKDFSRVLGVVIDNETEVGLPNANVIIPMLDIGTSTDESGAFTLNKVPKGSYRIEVSVIGYKRNIITLDLLDDEITSLLNNTLNDESTFSNFRVILNFRSIGWYGSVLVPSAITLHLYFWFFNCFFIIN